MALKLPRFLRTLSIVDEKGQPTLAFHQWWESVLRQVEQSINGIQQALEAAGIAQTAAATAQAAANQVTATTKLVNSGITGLTFTASDAGTDANITISNHTRVYGDGTSVAVNGATLTGRAYNTTYYVYYIDPSFVGGAVSYISTTVQADATQTGSKHLVGMITTPAAGSPPSGGGSPGLPGFGFETP